MTEKRPSAVFIYGNLYKTKNLIASLKAKHASNHWSTLSASEDLDEIRMEVSTIAFDGSRKFIEINDLPNQKAVREFLLDISTSCPAENSVIIWDSTEAIKLDPKTGKMNQTWSDFVDQFSQLPNIKIINHGVTLTESQGLELADFVLKKFQEKNKEIQANEIKILLEIVGSDIGLLTSEIEKLCINCPSPITIDFILEHAFPSSKEGLLYKLGNILDTGSYEKAVEIIKRFLQSGENENRLAETLLNKARWQMLASYYWSTGLNWHEIPYKLMDMGRFPSSIWHNDKLHYSERKQQGEIFQIEEQAQKYMVNRMGLNSSFLQPLEKLDKKITRGPSLPMPFIAEQTVSFVRNKIVNPYVSKFNDDELRNKVLDRSIKVYLFVQDKLAEVRYGSNPVQDLMEMARVLTDFGL